MKYTKILRILSITIILSLLLVALPVRPAYAGSIEIDPEEGTIGTEVTVVGEDFNESTETTEKYAVIFFSSQEASTVDDIDDDVDVYETVQDGIYLDENGEFEETFIIPDALTDGDDEEDVTTGTYYIYVCHYLSVSPPTLATRIRAVAEFNVIGGEIEIDPEEGPVATEVEIVGAEFSSRDNITIEYDGNDVDIADGDDETDSDGEFVSYILIPESTAGDHTITVTVAGSEVEAEFTVEPEIILNPTSGEADDTVTVSGTGFERRDEVIVYFENVALATVTTDSDGSFDTTIDVPDLEADIYDIEAEDESNNIDTAKFTVAAPPTPIPTPAPSPTPSPTPAPSEPNESTAMVKMKPTTGEIGDNLVLSGAGFEADTAIDINFDDETVATATADTNGIFVSVFQVPASTSGDHTVTITDGTNTEELTFTVQTEPPPVPAPLLPEMGITVKPPISFDWKSVTADNPPATYTLQIATDKDFPADSIVMEKKELTKSEYTISEEEALELADEQGAFYWRIRAVDGVGTPSDWTGPGQFFVTQPFSLPNWAIYTLLGIGGLLLFAIGYWMGRRTAYYY